MPFDRAVASTIWNGKVPVVLTLSHSDLATFKQPDPYYMMVARCNLIPLVITDQIRQHFQEFASRGTENDELWLEYNGVPLKWHLPVGVLFDLHAPQTHLPWQVSVHFRNFPADKLIRLSGEDAVQTHFFSMIKQTDYIKNGSTKKVMNLSKNDQVQLWDGFRTQQFDQFWSINSQLISDAGNYKAVPLRIYVDNGTVIQDLIPPTTSTGKATLLVDALRKCLPSLFPSPPGAVVFASVARRSTDTNDEDGDAGAAADDGDSAPTPESAPAVTVDPADVPPTDVIIHGIRPSLETPLLWLSDNMSYPDNFIHIVVRHDTKRR